MNIEGDTANPTNGNSDTQGSTQTDNNINNPTIENGDPQNNT